ncbi:ThuA domain-containing protein [Anaerobacillus sp. CMMVII]|uniref:ThuA domain-containing protein n=1 Tax=Anaerobacillus sp. CMMVII TaxID=2755588 RepID=UPI0021B705D2|nr:ThuA domain-containing protein [Anaerobacillus sp. CMMVII]MCT8138049.1 ThuA domain-containing protein [Anaerobacillus sp. CMMVII]
MPKRFLAILGDYYHTGEHALKSLEKTIKEYANNISVEYINVDHLTEGLETNPDAVILFKENRLNPQDAKVHTWMSNYVERKICDYVESGGGWISWHSGLSSYQDLEEYSLMTRGYFKYHPKELQRVKYVVDPIQDYLSDLDHFEIVDEHYFVHCQEEETNVFLRSVSVDGTSIAGWNHEFGEGRVVCLTPAHLEEVLLDPNLNRLLAKLMAWSCKLI